MIRKILTISLITLPFFLFGQTSGKLSGKVTDADGNPLAGANVIIEGTSHGAASNQDGAFVILDVPVGTYTVRCDYIGYSALKVSNIAVSSGLTSLQNFGLEKSAIEGQVVEVRAEKPIINKNSTNTTRIIDTETIENLPLRGVESIVALQTGTVSDDGNIYVRGSRAGDVAYYVDGVYMNNAYTLDNTSTVSNSAMQEVQFQSGGFSAEYGNINGGIVNTSTKVGGSSLDLSGEFVSGLGTAGSGTDDGLYSNGYSLYNVSLGGPLPISNKISYFINFEGRSTEDSNPTKHPFYAMDQTEITWALDSVGVGTADAYNGLYLNGNLVGNWADLETSGASFSTSLGTVATDSISGYDVINVSNFWNTGTSEYLNASDTTDYRITGYSNDHYEYGSKPNSGSDRTTLTGNLSFDLGSIRLKVGGLFNQASGRSYNQSYSLLNNENNPRWENNTLSMYANMAYAISDKSYIKINASSFNYQNEYGDNTWWNKYIITVMLQQILI